MEDLQKYSRLKVLLVDDLLMTRVILSVALQEAGILDVHEANNGEEAMALLTEANSAGRAFDIIFSDWHMPVMNGITFLKLVRANQDLKHLPFFMVSVESNSKLITEAVREGVDEYITKPFTPISILQKMKFVLEKKNIAQAG